MDEKQGPYRARIRKRVLIGELVALAGNWSDRLDTCEARRCPKQEVDTLRKIVYDLTVLRNAYEDTLDDE